MARPTQHDDKQDYKEPEVIVGTVDVEYEEEQAPLDVDEEYLSAPKGIKFYRSVLFQMILFGA